MKALPAEALEALRDPTISLPAYAKIIDQKTGREIRYDPYAITDKLQATVVGWRSSVDGWNRTTLRFSGLSGNCATDGSPSYPLPPRSRWRSVPRR